MATRLAAHLAPHSCGWLVWGWPAQYSQASVCTDSVFASSPTHHSFRNLKIRTCGASAATRWYAHSAETSSRPTDAHAPQWRVNRESPFPLPCSYRKGAPSCSLLSATVSTALCFPAVDLLSAVAPVQRAGAARPWAPPSAGHGGVRHAAPRPEAACRG